MTNLPNDNVVKKEEEKSKTSTVNVVSKAANIMGKKEQPTLSPDVVSTNEVSVGSQTEVGLTESVVSESVDLPGVMEQSFAISTSESKAKKIDTEKKQPTTVEKDIEKTVETSTKEATALKKTEAKEDEVVTPEKSEVHSGEKSKVLNPETTKAATATGANQTISQVLSSIAGYKAANTLAPSSGISTQAWQQLLQNTANSGDPQSATTWQSVLLLKLLSVILRLK